MPILIALLLLLSGRNNYTGADEVKITFNASGETRAFAYLKDTINIQFIPAVKTKGATYRIHNLSIEFSGISNTKENVKQPPVLIPDPTASKNCIIRIPIKKYLQTNIDNSVKIYIDIESIQKIYRQKTETLNLPKQQLHREFTCKDK